MQWTTQQILRLFLVGIIGLNFLCGCWAGAIFGITELNDSNNSGTQNKPPPPTAFTLLVPDEGSIVPALTPSFKWNNAEGETGYIIDIDDDITFTPPLIHQSPSIPADVTVYSTPSGILIQGTTYYWRVRALNTGGETVASNGPRSFDPVDTPIWARTFGGTAHETAYDIIETADGGYIFTGRTDTFSIGQEDIWVVKLFPDTSVEWSRSYGSGGPDISHRIFQTPDGGFFVIGVLNIWNITLLKLTSTGSVDWQKEYDAPTSQEIMGSGAITPDGGVVLCGFTNNTLSGLVIKVSSNGDIEWQTVYGGAGSQFINDIVPTNDGGYIFTGRNDASGAGGNDVWLVKLDSGGAIQWERTYGDVGEDYGDAIFQTADNGYLVGATHTWNPPTSTANWVLKILPGTQGQIDWQKRYWSGGVDVFHELPDGTLVIAGNWSGSTSTLLKLTGAGSEVWFRWYSDLWASGHMMGIASDGGFLLCGRSTIYGAGGSDVWALKVNPDGTIPPLHTTSSANPINTTITDMIVAPSSTETTHTATAQASTIQTITEPVVFRQAPP